VVHSVIYTRGEGGQNEIGPELYAALGAIRTAETEAAARHLGTQVRFLNFDDFGYSKHASETFERWGGEDEVTGRLVYLIRKLKPDVLFTNHDTLTVGPRTQHGHHQAVGISAYRAMQLAADPAYRPEHLAEEGVDLWQPQRLFLRLWRGGQDTADVRVPVGDLLPGADRSATDVAVRAIAEHRSQGFDTFAERFRRDTTHFVLLAQAPGAPRLPSGAIDLAAGLDPNPHAATIDLPHLIDSGRLPPVPRGAINVNDTTVTAGESLEIAWTAPPGQRLVLSGLVDTTLATPGAATVRVPASARATLPRKRAQYDRFVNHPPIQIALVGDDGRRSAAGHLSLDIAPALTLSLDETVVMPGGLPGRVLLRGGETALAVSGRVFSDESEAVEIDILVMSDDGAVVATASETSVVRDGRVEIPLALVLPEDIAPGTYGMRLSGRTGAGEAPEEVVHLKGHVLPEIALPPGLQVGLVRSYDRATEAALHEMGVSITSLDSLALARGDFSDLHTIVVDIRAYLVRPDLRAHNQRLLDWVRGGGHLVVTYQKTFEWNDDHPDPFIESATNPAGFAPYPLRLGRDRVTREDAPVRVLQPDHPFFSQPNPIHGVDWEGWIQERGLYFPASYDHAYVELFEMSDPGERPLRSSTLLADYGDGTYLFSALGWYRQLGAFVPGAYRQFANMISLPLVDGRQAP